jgi:hypothetical protein
MPEIDEIVGSPVRELHDVVDLEAIPRRAPFVLVRKLALASAPRSDGPLDGGRQMDAFTSRERFPFFHFRCGSSGWPWVEADARFLFEALELLVG